MDNVTALIIWLLFSWALVATTVALMRHNAAKHWKQRTLHHRAKLEEDE